MANDITWAIAQIQAGKKVTHPILPPGGYIVLHPLKEDGKVIDHLPFLARKRNGSTRTRNLTVAEMLTTGWAAFEPAAPSPVKNP
jgi:hypothetical protein